MLHLYSYKTILKFILFFFLVILLSSCGEGINDESISSKSLNSDKLIVSRVLNSGAISIFTNIVLEFSEDLNLSTITSSNIFIVDQNATLVGSSIKLDLLEQSKIIVTPYRYFKPLTNYSIVVKKGGIKDLKGRVLSKDYYYRFITTNDGGVSGDFNVSLIKPSNDASMVDPHSDISIEFSRFVALENDLNIANLLELTNSNGVAVRGKVSVLNSVLSFAPSKKLQYSTSYSIKLKKSVYDMYGNKYDIEKNKNIWNFQTANKFDAYTNSGFNDLNLISLNKQIFIVRTIKNTLSESTIVVATEDSLELYKVIYKDLVQKPIFKHISTLPINFQTNSMMSFNDKYIMIGSAKRGIYTYKIIDNLITEVSHIVFNEYIYGVSIYGTKAYSVGPKDGLRSYDLDLQSGVISPLKHIRLKQFIMLDVIAKENKIFVADYNGAVLIYDDNFANMKKVSIKGSVKRLLNDNEKSEIFVFNSIGVITKMDYNGNIIEELPINLPNPIKDINSLLKPDGSIERILISDFNKNIITIDNNLQNFSIVDNNMTASISGLFGYSTNLGFMVLVSSDGKLSIKNLISDTVGSIIKKDNLTDNILALDGSIIFDIEDDYLDSKQIIKENFVFKNSNTNVMVDYNISLEAKDNSSITCKITPKQLLIKDNSYMFLIKSSLIDMIGNPLDGGDYSMNFKAEDAKLKLTGDTTVNEGSSATYIISLDRVTKVDLSVKVKLAYISANISELTMQNSTYIIPAGSKEVTFNVATINNTYENKDKKYSIELEDVSSGGGFNKIYTDTTTVVTTIVNDDIARVSDTSTNISGTEGTNIVHKITMSNVAKYDKVYSYSIPYAQNIGTASFGTDYEAIPLVSSNVVLDTNSKTITVPKGVSSFDFTIVTIDDNIVENSETYTFVIDSRSGQGTIVDNDFAAIIPTSGYSVQGGGQDVTQ